MEGRTTISLLELYRPAGDSEAPLADWGATTHSEYLVALVVSIHLLEIDSFGNSGVSIPVLNHRFHCNSVCFLYLLQYSIWCDYFGNGGVFG